MIGAVQNLLDIAAEQQEEIQRIRSGALSKRMPIVGTLSEVHTDIMEGVKNIKTNEFRAYEDIIAFRDSLKALALTCQSLSVLVEKRELKPRALVERLAPVYDQLSADIQLGNGFMKYLADAQAGEGEDDSKIRREQAAASRSDRILKALRAAYEHKIPKEMSDSLHFVSMPIMATFKNMAMNHKSLSAMGFPVVSAGLHSTPSSDLGIIFENQMLMLFRMEDAEATERVHAEAALKNDNIVRERSDKQKERQAARREIKRLTAKLEGAKPRMQAVISRTIGELCEDVQELTTQLDNMEVDYRHSRQRLKAKSNLKAGEDHLILNFADPIVQAVNRQRDTNLTLFTAKPLKGLMRDADVVAVWLMDKKAVQLIQKHTNQDPKLSDWFLPWNS